MPIRRADAGDNESGAERDSFSPGGRGGGEASSLESASLPLEAGDAPGTVASALGPSAARGKGRALALLLGFGVVSLVTRVPFLRAGFVNVDEAAHLLGSWELLRGGRLYQDFTDNKPPLVYVFYAGAQLLFGEGLLAVRLLSAALWTPLIALGASAFFGHSRRGVAAGLAFLVASATMLASDAHAVHCEHVMLLPLVWALVALRSPAAMGRPGALLTAGVLIGIATLGKQPAALCLAIPGIGAVRACLGGGRGGVARSPTACPRRVRARALAACWGALLLGFALPLGAAAAFLAREGTLGSAVFWVWQYNLQHIDNPMPLADKALRVASMGALLLPATAPLALGAWGRGASRCGHRRAVPLLLATCTFLPGLLGLRMFGHYFVPFVLALALAAAPFLAGRSEGRGAGGRRGAGAPGWLRPAIVGFGVFAFVTFTVVSKAVFARDGGVADVSRGAYERIGEALREDGLCRGGSLFVWGYAPTVYAYAGQRPASRFVVPIDTLTGYLAENEAAERGRVDTAGRIDEGHWDQLIADLEARRPSHLVDTAPADMNRWGGFAMARFPRLMRLVERDYHPFAVVDGAVLYRRNECAAKALARPESCGTHWARSRWQGDQSP